MWLQIISGQLPACKALCALGGCVRQNVKLCFSVCTCDQVCLLIGTSCLFFLPPSISPLEVDVWCVCVWTESKRDSFSACVCVESEKRNRKPLLPHLHAKSEYISIPNCTIKRHTAFIFSNSSSKKHTFFIFNPPLLNAEHTPCVAKGRKKKCLLHSPAEQSALMCNSS